MIDRRLLFAALLLFFGGMAALVYQVVWFKELRLIFGASTASTAAVLAIFMGGLGLGSLVLGPKADRHLKPLLFYGRLEAGIAAMAALSPLLILLANELYLLTGGIHSLGLPLATAVRLFLAAVVLGVPAFLMGGTLPASARAITQNTDISRSGMAFLYGINTLGAVIGVVVAAFIFLEMFGQRQTLWMACLVNAMVALCAIRAGRAWPENPPDPITPAPPAPEAPPSTPVAPPAFVLLAAGGVGFAFFLMELVWYRLLGPLLGGTTYAFGIILALALFGMALGGLCYTLFGAHRKFTLHAFALTCLLEAFLVLLPFALGDRVALLAGKLEGVGDLGFHYQVMAWGGVGALVVLPSAFLSGIQFPLLVGLLGEGRTRVGKHLGAAYATNTVGAILGALLGGFGLIPLLSLAGSLKFAMSVLALLGIAALILGYRRTGWGPASTLVVPLAAAVVLILFFGPMPGAVWKHSGIGAGRAMLEATRGDRNALKDWENNTRRFLADEWDGWESNIGLASVGGYSLLVNGKSDGNVRADAGTQIMAGLIGTALHPDPVDTLVIGLGVGGSAGWMAAVESVDRVDVVELEPAVAEVARLCGPVNHDLFENPAFHLYFNDGREFLRTVRQTYDVILSEPSNPYRAGVASLFTREFYQHAGRRLNPGGLFVQWVQAYEIDAEAVRFVFATLREVFPYIETWQPQGGDLLFVCSFEPLEPDLALLRERMEEEPYASALRRVWRLEGLEGFLSGFVADTTFADHVARGSSFVINTDNLNHLEFAVARSVGRRTAFNVNDLVELSYNMGTHRPPWALEEVNWPLVDEMFPIKSIYYGRPVPPPPGLDEDANHRVRAMIEYSRNRLARALQEWERQDAPPQFDYQLLMLADCLAHAGREETTEYLEPLAAWHPVEGEVIAAVYAMTTGDEEAACRSLNAALRLARIDPWFAQPVLTRGLRLARALAEDEVCNEKLLQSLSEPFSVSILEGMRRTTLLDVARRSGEDERNPRTLEALALFEPNPIWTEQFLSLRYRVYNHFNDPLTNQAFRDLEQFIHWRGIRFASGLDEGAAPQSDPQ